MEACENLKQGVAWNGWHAETQTDGTPWGRELMNWLFRDILALNLYFCT